MATTTTQWEQKSLFAFRDRAHTLAGARAVATERAYSSDARAWIAFALSHGLDPNDPNGDDLAAWAVSCVDCGLRIETVRRRLAGVRASWPAAEISLARAALRGLARTRAVRPRSHVALPVADWRRCCRVLSLDLDWRSVRDRAWICAGFVGALRSAELAALRWSDFDDVARTLLLRRTKTDQVGAGRVVPLAESAEASTDASLALQAWRPVAQERLCGRTVCSLAAGSLTRVLRRRLVAAGVDGAERYTWHSLRAGMVTAAADGGATDASICVVTGHRSPRSLTPYRQLALFGDSHPLAGVLK